MSAPFEVRTERLLLRQWRDEDGEPLARLLADPELMRYIRGRPLSDREADAVFARRREQWERYGFGFWAVEPLRTGRLAGWVGLQHPDWMAGMAEEVEIGWMLARAHWGKGLATEGAVPSVRVAFETLGLERLLGFHHPDNRRVRVLTRESYGRVPLEYAE
ncbi:MAG: GNAT family N-acetyltransferase [Coriobacteriia bacterium]|nr:GNAT family N-acetyltransferase [Coriobacteriia bacterium]